MTPPLVFLVAVEDDLPKYDDTHTTITVTVDPALQQMFEGGFLTWNEWHELAVRAAGLMGRVTATVAADVMAGILGHHCRERTRDGETADPACGVGGNLEQVTSAISFPDPPLYFDVTVPAAQVDFWAGRITEGLAAAAADDELSWPDGYKFSDPWLEPR